MSDDLLRTGFDPAQRELCPDGVCIGVIGPDGRCRECGKQAPGGAPATPAAKPATKSVAPGASTAPRSVEGDGFDPTLRELCPDGACIGVIGPDGRCKECGTPSPTGPPPAGTPAPGPDDGSEPDAEPDADPDAPADPPPGGETPASTDDFDPSGREVCPDGACIGVIGPDGRCKECGRSAG